MAPAGECEACEQPGRTKFYCQVCLKERLRIHHQALARLASAHSQTTFRAASLLNTADSPASLARKDLRAERADLKERIRVKKEETARLREELDRRRQDRDARAARIRARKESLRQAKERRPLPDSVRTLVAASVREWDLVLAALVQIRRVLIAELLHVFPITRATPSVRDKGKAKARFPFQSVTSEPPRETPELYISGIPLPAASVDDIRGHRPDETSAAVSHAAHVVRLLALYLGVKLPFQLVLGPKPGIRPIQGSIWAAKFPAKKHPYPLALPPHDTSQSLSPASAGFLTALSMLSWTALYLSTTQITPKSTAEPPLERNASALAYILATVSSRHLGHRSHVTASGSHEIALARPETATIEGADLAVWVDEALATKDGGTQARRADDSPEDEGWSLL